jgi:hypothetical protein
LHVHLQADDGKDKLEKGHHPDDVGDVIEGLAEEPEDGGHPWDAAHETQRAQHTQQAHEARLGLHHDREDRREQDEKVEAIPRVAQIPAQSVAARGVRTAFSRGEDDVSWAGVWRVRVHRAARTRSSPTRSRARRS